MTRTWRPALVLSAVALMVLGSASVVAAQDEEAAFDDESPQVVLDWNVNTLAAAGTAGVAPAVTNLYMAMVHGAMHDAVNAIAGRYQPYLEGLEADPTRLQGGRGGRGGAWRPRRVVPRPGGRPRRRSSMPPCGRRRTAPSKDAGVDVGEAAAAAMLAAREGDGRGQTTR